MKTISSIRVIFDAVSLSSENGFGIAGCLFLAIFARYCHEIGAGDYAELVKAANSFMQSLDAPEQEETKTPADDAAAVDDFIAVLERVAKMGDLGR